MTDRVRQQVLDYLLGVLDDAEMAAVEARLESDPVYRDAMRWARGSAVRLDCTRRGGQPPSRLAERTCQYVLDPAQRLARMRTRSMTPAPAVPHAGCRLNRADVGVAVAIFFIAGLLVLPAISGMRFQARLTACQDNLRHVGQALAEYSQKNHNQFPAVPIQGNLSAAGVYAPILADDGYLTESGAVLCPESPQAQQKDFRVPTLAELRSAVGQELSRIQHQMGGSYGYCLGYFDHGVYQPTRNLNRDYFAIMADAPSDDRPNHQSDNHGGLGQNVLFEDLHVKFCTKTRLAEGTDDFYTNDNRQVAPGLHRDDSVIAASGTAPVVSSDLVLISMP